MMVQVKDGKDGLNRMDNFLGRLEEDSSEERSEEFGREELSCIENFSLRLR